MDFSFSPDQESVRQLAAKMFADHGDGKLLREAEQADWFQRPLWQALAQGGLLGAAIPVENGGSGMGLVELCLVLEQLGRHVAPVPLWATLCLGALPIDRFGSGEQKRLLLGPVAAGELVLTAALGELDGGDPARPRTKAVRDGEGWRLEGEKVAVPAAHLAGRCLVPARTGDSVTIFLVDPKGPGVTLATQRCTTGEPLARLTFDGAPVGQGDLLGDVGQGAAVLGWLVPRATVGLCAIEAGVARRQLEMTAEYTTRRLQFERPIASFQAVGQRAADAWIDAEAIRLSMWQAAFCLARDGGGPAALEVATAKFWASEAGARVAATAQHLHGGMGFDKGYPLYRYFLWAKQIELTLGGPAQQLERIGAALAGDAS